MKLAVYCGASSGVATGVYQESAYHLGQLMAQQSIELVYGGASVGLMGAVADGVLAAGGQVHGVMPQVLVDKEQAHAGLTTLHVVDDMHQRKAAMMALADGFIALPGGTGTLEELFEVWAWRQIGLHDKSFALFNISGYYDHLLAFIRHACAEEFVRPDYRDMLMVADSPQSLLALFNQRDESCGISPRD